MAIKHRVLRIWLLGIVCCFLSSTGICQRILIVTTEQCTDTPGVYPVRNGQYVASDMTAAGYPFDVVTYGRFVNMSLANYDIIFLNGHTSPTLVSSVAAKCQAAKQEGHKIFINGNYPYSRYNKNGNQVEYLYYVLSLFNVGNGGYRYLSGVPVLPASIQKDPDITAVGIQHYGANTFNFNTEPAIKITINGYCIGFLYPEGGAIDGTPEYLLGLLDYGRVASYLRYGNPTIIGFANDRMEGFPIASFEVHCDNTRNIQAIDGINALSLDYQVPFLNLLVYNNLDTASIAKWNSVAAANPLMAVGSHSRSHPSTWSKVPDVLYETRDALDAQRLLIPATGNYFNFSGDMSPTTTQIDQIYTSGIIFGAAGSEYRMCRLPSGEYMYVQKTPTRRDWFIYLSRSTTTPFCPSQTLDSDYWVHKMGRNYFDEVKTNFDLNVKYGMYTYGYIHDYYFISSEPDMHAQIRSAIEYLQSQSAKFIFADQLILRVRDYIAGQITSTTNPDGSITVVASRPNAHVNDIKVGFKNDLTPTASGASVVSQRLAGDYLYITLLPENLSTVHVQWDLLPPVPPVVTSSGNYISNLSEVQWKETAHPSGIAEYQYAVGTTPGGTDAQGWVSAGTSTSGSLNLAVLHHGSTYYVSVRARYASGPWSDPGASNPMVADLTAPPNPLVLDDGDSQSSTSHLHATWTAQDPESGTMDYLYAIGSTPGSNDVLDWTPTTQTDVDATGLNLWRGLKYYISVRARNKVGLWGEPGVSDGMLISLTAPAPIIPIGTARNAPNGAIVALESVIVTATFPGEFYVESSDRSAGIKVVSPASFQEGDIVNVVGIMNRDSVERFVCDANVEFVDHGSVQPMHFRNCDIGGKDQGLVFGVTNGVGLNSVGLLATTSGRIDDAGSDYIYIKDGSVLKTNSGPVESIIKVLLPESHDLEVGSYVLITGIISLETDGVTFRPLIQTRRNSEVVVLVP